MFQFVKEDTKTGIKKPLGQGTKKDMMFNAPSILDYELNEIGIGLDERDNLISDFMESKGKKIVEVNGYKFYLAKDMFDAWGNLKKKN